MFEDDDDFEIDEEFLDGVFDAEKSATQRDVSNVSLDITRNEPEDSINNALEPSPVKRRKSSPSSSSSSSSSMDAAVRTSEESARLIAVAAQRRQSSQTISGIHSNQDSHEKDVDKESTPSQNEFGLQFGNNKQSNASGHTFLKPTAPCDKGIGVNNSPVSRSSPRGSLISETSFTMNTSRVVRQRKFPGPAGLLPDRGRTHVQGQRPNFSSLLDTSGSDLEDEEPLCSQSAASVLEDGPWSALQSDLAGEGHSLLRRYTITWVKQKAAARQLVGQKIPFLAAVLHSIDCSSPDPCVVLRDQTGTLHRSVWDSFGGQLVAGSALVLRLVGVLSTGISARRHYLNITSNNIVTIYSSPLCESSVPDTRHKVRKTDVHKWTLTQLLQAADGWEDQRKRKKDVSTGAHPTLLQGTTNPFSSNMLNRNSGTARPPMQLSSHSNNTPAVNTGSLSTRPPVQSANFSRGAPHLTVSGIARPQMQSVNRGSVASSSPQAASQNNPLRQQNSFPKPANCDAPAAQGRFVPKRPTFSVGGQARTEAIPCSTSSVTQGNQSTVNTSKDLFSDADDIDISSVLDGIDSESLFGEF
ncbi:uncharacterized protein LOC117643127 isoform X2 [Thrips palmi]|uniref:Uncharacterized protein LOC117643127 isoform X2 n=1 Tax=Thrips palmi TaxID=161013 RepID=A0A6P8YLL6_THRPL|nr:uncharacterized protein LOC117643127 isoform X2 [Thrips palmi]